MVIASNTGHIALEAAFQKDQNGKQRGSEGCYSALPFLHIADCTAEAIKSKGLKKIGLLGTEPTMTENYLKGRLQKHGLEVIVPTLPADLNQIFQFIMHELGFGVFKPSTLAFFKDQVEQLVARGAEGVILGCTET